MGLVLTESNIDGLKRDEIINVGRLQVGFWKYNSRRKEILQVQGVVHPAEHRPIYDELDVIQGIICEFPGKTQKDFGGVHMMDISEARDSVTFGCMKANLVPIEDRGTSLRKTGDMDTDRAELGAMAFNNGA